MNPWCFPNPVLLPDTPVIENLRLSIALGQPSRQLIHTWRRNKGFPVSYRNGNSVFYMTDDVEQWLKDKNIKTDTAIIEGDISPEEGKSLAAILKNLREIESLDDIRARLDDLEAAAKERL